MNKEKEIRAITNIDLDNILMQLGMLNEFQNGECLCASCREKISYDNIGAILPYSQGGKLSLKFFCSNPDCLTNMK